MNSINTQRSLAAILRVCLGLKQMAEENRNREWKRPDETTTRLERQREEDELYY